MIAHIKRAGGDDHPNGANLIGYSYRKLGDYKLAQVWYERALKSRSEPSADLEVLRPVADRAGQSRSGGLSPEPDRRDLRDRLRGVPLVGGGARTAARHRPGLPSSRCGAACLDGGELLCSLTDSSP